MIEYTSAWVGVRRMKPHDEEEGEYYDLTTVSFHAAGVKSKARAAEAVEPWIAKQFPLLRVVKVDLVPAGPSMKMKGGGVV